jgi:hypothetical protein
MALDETMHVLVDVITLIMIKCHHVTWSIECSITAVICITTMKYVLLHLIMRVFTENWVIFFLNTISQD